MVLHTCFLFWQRYNVVVLIQCRSVDSQRESTHSILRFIRLEKLFDAFYRGLSPVMGCMYKFYSLHYRDAATAAQHQKNATPNKPTTETKIKEIKIQYT